MPGGPATPRATAASCRSTADRPLRARGRGPAPRRHRRLRDLGRARPGRVATPSSCATPSPATATPPARSATATRRRAGGTALIGPGRPIDTDRWFVVCANVLGGCQGTTGPASPHPGPTGRPYGSRFPVVTIRDMVRTQAAVADAPRHRPVAQRRRRLDGRHAGARVGRDVPRAGARRWSRSPPRWRPARSRSRWWCTGRRAIRTRPEVARRRLLRRRARRRARTPASRSARMVAPDHLPQRRRVHRPLRARASVEPLDGLRRCGSASRSSATSSTTATSSSAASTPTRYLLLTKAMDLHDLGRGRGGSAAALRPRSRAPTLAIGVELRHPLPALPAARRIAGRARPGGDAALRRDRQPARPRRLPASSTTRSARPLVEFLDDVEKSRCR